MVFSSSARQSHEPAATPCRHAQQFNQSVAECVELSRNLSTKMDNKSTARLEVGRTILVRPLRSGNAFATPRKIRGLTKIVRTTRCRPRCQLNQHSLGGRRRVHDL